MNLYVFKNPSPIIRATKIYADESPGPGFELTTEEEFADWLAVQPPLPELAPLVDATPEWIGFGLALASLPEVDGLLATVESASRPLERMLSGGLLQAAQGDPRTFLAAWAKVVEHGLISPELIQLVAGLASQYNLPAVFVAALDP
jgi:hypothetical protein